MHRGGIAIIWKEEEGWRVEGAKIFGTNVVGFTITAGRKRWYAIRAYMPPNNQTAVHRVHQALAQGTEGVETLLVGDLNARSAQPWDRQKKNLANNIANYGLVDQTLYFIPRRRYRGEGGWLWRMWRDGRPITERGDYILGTDHRDFYNICIREPRVSTYHWMILEEFKGYGEWRNCKYCRGEDLLDHCIPK